MKISPEVSVGEKKDMSISQGNGHILFINANKSIQAQLINGKNFDKKINSVKKRLEEYTNGFFASETNEKK